MNGSRELVLVGGGHAHVLVLDAWARRPEPGVAVTLISPSDLTPYSGMLPGHVAGLYSQDEMHIDLPKLAARSGARFVQDEALGFDGASKQVLLRNGPRMAYDALSIDIGITPDVSGIAGAAEHALVVKPIGTFLEKWAELRERALTPGGPRRMAVIGGGLAGICLVFAIRAALRKAAPEHGLDPAAFDFVLVSAEPPIELNPCMRRMVARALQARGIALHAGRAAVAIEPGNVRLDDGGTVAADAALISTAAAPPPALRDAGFATDSRGFLAVRPSLQVLGEEDVFAAGDCASVIEHPRPKAGVFAVRQGPVLAENLRRHLRGEALVSYVPQKRHLVLIGTGDGRAIGGRGRFIAFEGRFAWWLKDVIDRRFMRRFA